jgi:hypothetical protein
MNRLRRLAGCAFTAVLAVGCGSTPSAGLSPGPSPAEDTPTPVATIDERGLVTGRLSCSEGETFPAAALAGPGGAELSTDPAAAVLRTTLNELPDLPRSGWHLVTSSPERVLFVARGERDEPWVMVALMNSPSGWTVDAYGGCGLQVELGPGLETAVWWTDPASRLDASTTRFTALVQERSCASGQPPDGRIAAPAIVYGATSVVIVFATLPLSGPQDCPSAPPGKYTVELKEPLGKRQLLDGGLLPPRDATKPPA